jgi:RNA polymerase sigma factor (sigma-70 family)
MNVESAKAHSVTGLGVLLPSRRPPEASGAAETAGARVQLQCSAGTTASPEFLRQIEEEIPFLRRTVRRWHREKADADDLVQDTLVQALANAHLWQPGSDLRGWLYTIMRNRFLGTVAKSHRSASALDSIAAADPGPPADASELRLLLRDLAAALRRLPSNQRSAVLLIGIEGKSYDEAAQTMGTSVGAVRSHLMRGRDRLRTAVCGTDTRAPFAPNPAGSPAAIAPRGMRAAPAAAAGAD